MLLWFSWVLGSENTVVKTTKMTNGRARRGVRRSLGLFASARIIVGRTLGGLNCTSRVCRLLGRPLEVLAMEVPVEVSSKSAGVFANCESRRGSTMKPAGNNIHFRPRMGSSRMGTLSV